MYYHGNNKNTYTRHKPQSSVGRVRVLRPMWRGYPVPSPMWGGVVQAFGFLLPDTLLHCRPDTLLHCRPDTLLHCRPDTLLHCRPGTLLHCRPDTLLHCRPDTLLHCRPDTLRHCRPGTLLHCRPDTWCSLVWEGHALIWCCGRRVLT